MDDWTPDTQPDGAMTPPPRVPPTAVATMTPQPPRKPTPKSTRAGGLIALLDRALDALDAVAERIANAVGLR